MREGVGAVVAKVKVSARIAMEIAMIQRDFFATTAIAVDGCVVLVVNGKRIFVILHFVPSATAHNKVVA